MEKSALFQSFTPEERAAIGPFTRRGSFAKGAVIFHAGQQVAELGIVLSGSVHIEANDLWGNRSILGHVAAGEVFAETYALCTGPLLVDAVATEACSVEFLRLPALLAPANAEKSWYGKLQANLIAILASKNLALSGRMFCTGAKTIRGRVLTYLSAQAVQCGTTMLQLPFDRQQLADYLNVDRSALSKELGKMQRDGLLEYYKNTFRLHTQPAGGQA